MHGLPIDERTNAAETPKRHRRRLFQFSLRTLLACVVLVAVACGYLSHEASIVRARKAWLSIHGHPLEDAAMAAQDGLHADPEKSPSWLRRWVGDKAQDAIFLNEPSPSAVSEATDLFPEARIIEMHPKRSP
jgi:hypothetical protein